MGRIHRDRSEVVTVGESVDIEGSVGSVAVEDGYGVAIWRDVRARMTQGGRKTGGRSGYGRDRQDGRNGKDRG